MRTRLVGPAFQAKKGRNKAVVRDGGEVLQEEADFELSMASRNPSSFSDNPNRAALYVPNDGMGCWRSAPWVVAMGLIN